MLISFEKLLNYNNVSILWLDKNPNNKNTKLGYHIEKLSKPIKKLLQPLMDLNEEKDMAINDKNADNALTNPTTGAFLYDIIKDKDGAEVQKFQYSPASRKKRDLEIRAIIKKYEEDLEKLLATEIEFDKQYFVNDIPLNLTIMEIDAFTDIVIEKKQDK